MTQSARKQNPADRQDIIGDRPIEKQDVTQLELTPMRDAAAEARRRADDEEDAILDELRIDDQKRGEEWGTDETLNEGNSALSDEPSNGRVPRGMAVAEE